jgi:hypothetical protein
MFNFSIDARPTPDLFFTTDEGQQFYIDADGELAGAPEEDFANLRWASIDGPAGNEDVRLAIEMARSYAADNGWTLSDTVYFD